MASTVGLSLIHILHTGTLTETSLHQMQTELTQAVHAYLALDDIQISVLQQGGSLADLEQKASQSMLDFVRWASFLLTTAFGKKQELEQMCIRDRHLAGG